MNRRDLFKTLAAVPVAAAVAPLVIAGDGVALNSMAHPESAIPPTHEWHFERAGCIHCGLSQEFVEDNPADWACWTRLAVQRKTALLESFNETWDEGLSKVEL